MEKTTRNFKETIENQADKSQGKQREWKKKGKNGMRDRSG